MRTFVFLAALVALALVTSQSWAQTAGTPFQAMTKERAIAGTTSIGTAVQILPSFGTPTLSSYRIVTSGCTGVVSVILVSVQGDATGAVPTPGTDQFTYTYPCPAMEVVSGPNRAWANVITSTGTATVYIIGGQGF